MDLSIIIVNYKTPALVIDCIHSIYSQPNLKNVVIEIVVVDNNSNDNSEEKIMQVFPSVIFIQMGYNSGFARANNVGIKKSSAPVVLLLNSDTIIKENAIIDCYRQFISSGYIACGVQLLNEDETPQGSGDFVIKGGINCLLPLPYIGNFIKRIAAMFSIKKKNISDNTTAIEIDWINGAFLMVKKSAIDISGMLDEDFFLYFEELEWCSRLKKVGKLCIYRDNYVIHLQGETSNEIFASSGKGYYNLFDKKGLQIMISCFLRIRKQFGVWWYLFNLSFYIITIPVFFIYMSLCKCFFIKSYSFKQWKGYTKNVMILMKHSAKMIGKKSHFYKML